MVHSTSRFQIDWRSISQRLVESRFFSYADDRVALSPATKVASRVYIMVCLIKGILAL